MQSKQKNRMNEKKKMPAIYFFKFANNEIPF